MGDAAGGAFTSVAASAPSALTPSAFGCSLFLFLFLFLGFPLPPPRELFQPPQKPDLFPGFQSSSKPPAGNCGPCPKPGKLPNPPPCPPPPPPPTWFSRAACFF